MQIFFHQSKPGLATVDFAIAFDSSYLFLRSALSNGYNLISQIDVRKSVSVILIVFLSVFVEVSPKVLFSDQSFPLFLSMISLPFFPHPLKSPSMLTISLYGPPPQTLTCNRHCQAALNRLMKLSFKWRLPLTLSNVSHLYLVLTPTNLVLNPSVDSQHPTYLQSKSDLSRGNLRPNLLNTMFYLYRTSFTHDFVPSTLLPLPPWAPLKNSSAHFIKALNPILLLHLEALLPLLHITLIHQCILYFVCDLRLPPSFRLKSLAHLNPRTRFKNGSSRFFSFSYNLTPNLQLTRKPLIVCLLKLPSLRLLTLSNANFPLRVQVTTLFPSVTLLLFLMYSLSLIATSLPGLITYSLTLNLS